MGRTLPSFTQLIQDEQNALGKFRRALRKQDQHAFDDLFRAARIHVAACAYASHTGPIEIMLLAMLLEEHKRVMHLQILLERFMEQPNDAALIRLDFRCLSGDDDTEHDSLGD